VSVVLWPGSFQSAEEAAGSQLLHCALRVRVFAHRELPLPTAALLPILYSLLIVVCSPSQISSLDPRNPRLTHTFATLHSSPTNPPPQFLSFDTQFSRFLQPSETLPTTSARTSFLRRDPEPEPEPVTSMFHSVDTTAWLSVLSRRKLQSAASPDRSRDADKLLRKVLLRNSISRVDLALAEAQSSSPPLSPILPTLSSPQQPIPIQSDPEPSPSSTLRVDEDGFVFPDATSLATSRIYSVAEENAEAKWLDSVLEDLSDDEYDEDVKGHAAHGASSDEEDDTDDFDLDWLLSTTVEEPQPIISVPTPTPPTELLTLEHLLSPFEYPLPEDDDDDLSTAPGMDDDVEDESEADSVEWPLTPGHRSINSMLGRSTSNSALNQLVASAGREEALPPITEEAVFQHNVRPAIHFDEPRLYRYSPALNDEQQLISPATPALGPTC
jgi:hypothetical protein